MRLLVLVALQSALLAVGQVALKWAMLHTPRPEWSVAFVRSVAANWRLAVAGLFFTAAGLLWLHIVRHWPLSVAYPLTSLSYVVGMAAAVMLLHEPADGSKWLGVALIVAGCFIISR